MRKSHTPMENPQPALKLIDRPKVSLIVCTRNRASRLMTFLKHCSYLEAPTGGWELVLVDNASADETAQVARSFETSAQMEFRYVYAPRPGLARARNAGIAGARGDVLAFTDDDCYPRADYLTAVAAVFAEHDPGFAGGRVLLHDPSDAKITVQDSETPSLVPPRSVVRAGSIHGANMAVSREVFEAIGGFDPHLGAGTPAVAGEDTEYLARAAWAGWQGRYDPRPVVFHDHGRKPGPDEARLRRGYDYGRGAYFASMLLRPEARRAYLAAWYRRARKSTARQIARELVGAATYLKERAMHSDRAPYFERRTGMRN